MTAITEATHIRQPSTDPMTTPVAGELSEATLLEGSDCWVGVAEVLEQISVYDGEYVNRVAV